MSIVYDTKLTIKSSHEVLFRDLDRGVKRCGLLITNHLYMIRTLNKPSLSQEHIGKLYEVLMAAVPTPASTTAAAEAAASASHHLLPATRSSSTPSQVSDIRQC